MITKHDVLAIIHSLTMRKAQNEKIWKLLMQPLLSHFNSGTLNLKDLAALTIDLYIIKLQSPKLF